MKMLLSLFALVAPVMTMAQNNSSAELTCRAQSKEIAVQTYNNCMTTSRNQQVEDIRKNYKKELQAVKSKYEGELKKLSAATKSTKTALKSTTPAVKPETSVDSVLDSAQNLSDTETVEIPSQE